MSWRKEDRRAERGYHHGNLKEALLEAALRLIAEKGPAGFTFADAARSAGVSPAAPYRHFRDAEALLAEVALRGFEQFAVDLTAAWNDGRPLPVRASIRCPRRFRASPTICKRCLRGWPSFKVRSVLSPTSRRMGRLGG